MTVRSTSGPKSQYYPEKILDKMQKKTLHSEFFMGLTQNPPASSLHDIRKRLKNIFGVYLVSFIDCACACTLNKVIFQYVTIYLNEIH